MFISRKRREYLMENYPIDTPNDLSFFNGLDVWLDDVEQLSESGYYTVKFPDGNVAKANKILSKHELIDLLNDLNR